jgi:hypothetical protein
MITIEKVDTTSKPQVEEFVKFPFSLYQNIPQWVPPILLDVRIMLNKEKHPFYEHSEAEFFVARENGKLVARIGLLENKPYNNYHSKNQASFYLFECVDDQSIANKLFEFSFDWVKKRKLNKLVGPKGFSPFDGYGLLVEGFEHRQMMTMMNYNLPNYPRFLENIGFNKVVDWVSCYTGIDEFRMPEKVHEIAKILEKRGSFKVLRFKNKSDLKKWGMRIGHAYNKTFINNWEYYPLTENEIIFNMNNLLTVAIPDLFKIITYKDEVVGFLLAFPDISAALQRQKGSTAPWAIADYLIELKRTDWVSFNGVGVLPEFHGLGGNYLMFSEMEKSAHGFSFKHGELTQVAESATQMRKDLVNLGVKPYKNHRIYGIDL